MPQAKEIKYGWLYGPRSPVPCGIGASEVFKHLGGAFAKSDAAGYLDIADSGNAELIGWLDGGDYTASSTDGVSVSVVDISTISVYRMPSDAAIALTDRWETCDLIVNSSIQQIDIGESNEDVLIVRDFNIANVTGDVSMNPSKIGSVGVA